MLAQVCQGIKLWKTRGSELSAYAEMASWEHSLINVRVWPSQLIHECWLHFTPKLISLIVVLRESYSLQFSAHLNILHHPKGPHQTQGNQLTTENDLAAPPNAPHVTALLKKLFGKVSSRIPFPTPSSWVLTSHFWAGLPRMAPYYWKKYVLGSWILTQ